MVTQVGSGPGVLDLNAITPQMVTAAGMSQQQFNQGLGNIPYMPVTQEEKDKLGRVRQRRLKIVRISSIVLLVMSAVAILDGIIAVVIATTFPHRLGGGMIAGFPCLLIGGLGLWLTTEGKKTPTGDVTTPRFLCILNCHMFWGYFLASVVTTAWGIAGVWALVDCVKRKPSDEKEWSFNNCTPNTSALTALAACTFIILTVVFITFMVNVCSYCGVRRAFGAKSGYERLLDMQMMRMAEMNRAQAQTQQPVNVYGQQHPGNMYGQQQPSNMYGQQQQPVNMDNQHQHHQQQYQPVYMQGQPLGWQMVPNRQQYGGYQPLPTNGQGPVPSAPTMENHSDDAASKSDPPPSYDEVVNK